MNLTDDLVSRSNGLLSIVPEVSDATGRYKMFNDGSTEVEVAEFLYGLVKVLKPLKILETGSYKGVSSLYMAQALKDNGQGDLVTLEISQSLLDQAQLLWNTLDVSTYIEGKIQPSLEFTGGEYDLIFLDTEPDIRFKELVKFFPNLRDGGFVLIHDLHEHLSQQVNEELGYGWPFGKLPDEVVNWIKEDKLRAVSFPTPRGFTLFWKVKETAYRV